MARHCEVIRGDDGEVIARVQLTGPLTDEERDALRKLVMWARENLAKEKKEET